MKKNNKKGFTLIELVIVATIMVMIMGAILNWIRPMNKFYQRTQAIADSNDVGSLLMDYVDDELRYATNIVILQNYDGVPKLSKGFLVDSSGNASSSVQFTDVLIIDSNERVVRGSRFADYVANSTPARRKGAFGCIIKADARDFIDTGKMKCLGGEPLYNEYGCNFQASLNTFENGSSSVTIDMELSRPTRDGAEYKFDKFGYKQKRDFELVNVNIKVNSSDNKKSGMKAEFYTSSGEGRAIDYGKFARASDPGSNPNASPMYAGGQDNTFTYILYTKKVPEEKEVTITLYNDLPPSAIKVQSQKITAGGSIPEEIYNNWKAIGESQTASSYTYNGGKYERKKFVKIQDKDGQDFDKYLETGIMSNMDFYIITTVEERNDPTYVLYFYDRFDDGGVTEYDPTTHPEKTEKTAGIFDDSNIVEFDSGGKGDSKGVYKFVGWLKDDVYNTLADPSVYPGPNPEDPADSMAKGWFVSGQEYSNSAIYYAVYKKNPTVTFHFEAADDSKLTAPFAVDDIPVRIDSDYDITQFMTDANYITYTNSFESLLNPGLSFLGWTVVDASGTDLGSLSSINLSSLTENETYRIIGDADSNPYPGSYLVTITIESVPSGYYHLQAGGYNADPNNSYYNSDVLILHEDGSIILNRGNFGAAAYPFVEGETVKMYVFGEKASINFTSGGSVLFEGESKWKYDGNNLTQIG